MRADLFLTEKGYAPSRKKAQILIEEGKVFVDGCIIRKASQQIDDGEHFVSVEQSDEVRFVGRGGLKLEAALDAFQIDANGKIALDKNNLPTSYQENHGFGTQSINSFCKKYNLSLNYEIDNDVFILSILF